MKLDELLKKSEIDVRVPPVEIAGLSYDSRNVRPGDLFFAVPGHRADGHSYVPEVVRKGAAAVVVERSLPVEVPLVKTDSVLKSMSAIANAFFNEPTQQIPVIGVTGTNGKTTVSYLIEDILRNSGQTSAVMGTVNYRVGKSVVPAPNTTPMSVDVHRFLAEAVSNSCRAAVMEVSSHALMLHRVDHVKFSIGVFMNLTQDHLDFHKTMEDYFLAKTRLFQRPEAVRSAVNIDDVYGKRLAGLVKNPLTFGMSAEANVRASNAVCDLSGISFDIKFPSGRHFKISNGLMGRHNISNCLAAAAALSLLGLEDAAVVQGLNGPHSVPGRLERVDVGRDFVVVVDYAHTHDALEQVLSTLRETGPRRLFCVFGAGGDRDRTKRPRMGKVAAINADHSFVTADNPRSEDPEEISKEIVAGFRAAGKNNYTVVVDRENAIRQALDLAQKGDIVLIAGKGHETYQIFKDKTVHFSDQETARRLLTQ